MIKTMILCASTFAGAFCGHIVAGLIIKRINKNHH